MLDVAFITAALMVGTAGLPHVIIRFSQQGDCSQQSAHVCERRIVKVPWSPPDAQ